MFYSHSVFSKRMTQPSHFSQTPRANFPDPSGFQQRLVAVGPALVKRRRSSNVMGKWQPWNDQWMINGFLTSTFINIRQSWSYSTAVCCPENPAPFWTTSSGLYKIQTWNTQGTHMLRFTLALFTLALQFDQRSKQLVWIKYVSKIHRCALQSSSLRFFDAYLIHLKDALQWQGGGAGWHTALQSPIHRGKLQRMQLAFKKCELYVIFIYFIS